MNFLGIRGIEESSVYQAILKKGEAQGRVEGRAEEAREILIFLGSRKLGRPDERTEARITAIGDRDRLHELIARVNQVAIWDELLRSSD